MKGNLTRWMAVLAVMAATSGQVQAAVIVNIAADDFGGVLFSWEGEINSLAGLTVGTDQGFSDNQVGTGFFFVGLTFGTAGYSGFSGTLDQPSFSPYGLIDGLSAAPGVGAYNGEIFFPDNYVLGTPFAGMATFPLTTVNSFTPSLVTWDGGNEFFQINNTVVPEVPLPAAAWLFGSALLGLGALKRKKA